MGTPVFIVGAGFSLAANSKYEKIFDKQLAKSYPLANDLGNECFGLSWDPMAGVECAFDIALQKRNREPLNKLIKLIQAADYFLGQEEARDPNSCYGKLIEHFPGASFISFNYDSLLEQVLLNRGLWNPIDGFGLPVEIGNMQEMDSMPKSKVLVIHLHKTMLYYKIDIAFERSDPNDIAMMKEIEPFFHFDPERLGKCFPRYERKLHGTEYQYPEDRIIPPIPDKREALQEKDVRLLFNRACKLLEQATQVYSIGYRFAECDSCSFDPLLKTIVTRNTQLWIVAPDAEDIAVRLRIRYPRLRVKEVSLKFEDWVKKGFTCFAS